VFQLQTKVWEREGERGREEGEKREKREREEGEEGDRRSVNPVLGSGSVKCTCVTFHPGKWGMPKKEPPMPKQPKPTPDPKFPDMASLIKKWEATI
jgi:hypothetical protein